METAFLALRTLRSSLQLAAGSFHGRAWLCRPAAVAKTGSGFGQDAVPDELKHAGPDLKHVPVHEHRPGHLEVVDVHAVGAAEVAQHVFGRRLLDLRVPAGHFTPPAQDVPR